MQKHSQCVFKETILGFNLKWTVCKTFAMCFFHHTVLNISNLGALYDFRFVVSLSLLLCYILYVISTTLKLKFTTLIIFLIYISVSDHGDLYF